MFSSILEQLELGMKLLLTNFMTILPVFSSLSSILQWLLLKAEKYLKKGEHRYETRDLYKHQTTFVKR